MFLGQLRVQGSRSRTARRGIAKMAAEKEVSVPLFDPAFVNASEPIQGAPLRELAAYQRFQGGGMGRPLQTDACDASRARGRLSGVHDRAGKHAGRRCLVRHAAPRSDDYVRKFARLVKEKLQPDLKVYIEYSSECWNGQLHQAKYCRDQGLERGLSDNVFESRLRFYSAFRRGLRGDSEKGIRRARPASCACSGSPASQSLDRHHHHELARGLQEEEEAPAGRCPPFRHPVRRSTPL